MPGRSLIEVGPMGRVPDPAIPDPRGPEVKPRSGIHPYWLAQRVGVLVIQEAACVISATVSSPRKRALVA